jgi:hypothetical protein
MRKGYENKRIKLNAPLRGHATGSEVTIKVDGDGVPMERYWRDRLHDAKVDNCIEFITSTSKRKQETKVASGENKEIGGKD